MEIIFLWFNDVNYVRIRKEIDLNMNNWLFILDIEV